MERVAEVPPEALAPVDFPTARAQFVRDTAAKYGIAPAEIEATLAKAQFLDSVVAAMSRPAERVKPWSEYRVGFLTQARIDGGRRFIAEHRDELTRVEQQYGVPAEVIVSIIGVETNYGGFTGRHKVLDALYTLAFRYPRSGNPERAAYEYRREQFFRDELAQLFALGREERLDIATLTGSYAGAMGWGQFMPSSYRDYAVDGDGDGKRDLFNDLDDVFASVANYFAKKGGWTSKAPVMTRAVRDPGAADFDNPGNSLTLDQTLASLQAKGYRPLELRFVSMDAGPAATLITLEGAAGPEYWIVYNNFKAITTYNISRLYATAVYQLSRAIAGREPEGP